MKALLAEKADPDNSDTVGRTALHEVASVVSNMNTPIAVVEAAVTCGLLLLNSGANVNKVTVGGRTPLHELYAKGQDDTPSSFTNILPSECGIGNGNRSGSATSSSSSSGSYQPTKYSFIVNNGQSKTILRLRQKYIRRFLRHLIQYGGSITLQDRSGLNAIHYACRDNNAGCVLEMLRSSASASSRVKKSQSGTSSIGTFSSESRSGKTASVSADSGGGSGSEGAYSLTTRTAQTPLHIACKVGATSVIHLLCRWEGDISDGPHGNLLGIRDSVGKLPRQYLPAQISPSVLDTLWGLAYSGNVHKLSTMLIQLQVHSKAEAGIDTDEHVTGSYSDDDLTVDSDIAGVGAGAGGGGNSNNGSAVDSGYVADSLEARNSATARNIGYGSGSGSVGGGVARSQDIAHEPWLIDSINSKTRVNRWTPLFACIVGWVRYEAATGTGTGTNNGRNNINTAAKRVVASSQIHRGRSSNPSSSSSSSSAKTVNQPQRRVQLEDTVMDKYLDSLLLLLRNHAYVDGADKSCRTPLMIACAANMDIAVKTLLNAGASVYSRDLDGNTPLHYAYAFSSATTIVLLEQVLNGRLNMEFQLDDDEHLTGNSNVAEAVRNHKGLTPMDVSGATRSFCSLLG